MDPYGPNWQAILGGPSVCTEVFIECHCCNKRLTLCDGHIDADQMTDDQAVTEAHKRNWTVGSADGQTLCPSCLRLPEDAMLRKFIDRLKDHYEIHELCEIWGASRKAFKEKRNERLRARKAGTVRSRTTKRTHRR